MKHLPTICLLLFIIWVLAYGVFYSGCPKGDSARLHRTRADLSSLAEAVKSYFQRYGSYPSQEEGFEALLTEKVESSESGELGPLLEELPLDPWGGLYVYRYPNSASGDVPEIISLGPDKIVSEDDLSNRD